MHKAKPSKPSPGHSKLSKGVLLKDEAHVSLPVTEQTIIHQQDATEEPAAAAECSSGDTVARVGRRESDTPSIQAERSVPSTDSSPSQRHQDMVHFFLKYCVLYL